MRKALKPNAQAIFDVVSAATNHPTALEVYEQVRRERLGIGLATVYRILHQLTEQGLLSELEQGSEGSRFDARTHRHDHAVCTSCGALLDIPRDVVISREALLEAARSSGIKLGSYEVRLYGQCATCQERSNDT